MSQYGNERVSGSENCTFGCLLEVMVAKTEMVYAAITLADEGGLDGVSMRKLAKRLDVSPMALYHHVRDRDELLDEMARVITGTQTIVTAEGQGARELLIHYAHTAFGALCSHPWLLHMVMTPGRVHQLVAPDDMQRLLDALGAAGLDADQSRDSVLGVSALAVGSASFVVESQECRGDVVRSLELALAAMTAGIEPPPAESGIPSSRVGAEALFA